MKTDFLVTWLKSKYSKTCVKRPPSKRRPNIGFQNQLSLNIYILSAVALNETNNSSCLHFSLQNIELSCDLDCSASGLSNINTSH